MQDQDKILFFLRTIGPTIPSKVAKHLDTEILLASAHLSDLAAQGKVKISHLKIGGSPLYYLPGQEEKLYYFAAGNLNPKDFQVLERLKQEKILREKILDLLSRVALRSLQDFAIPLHVTVAGNKELFWKWHLLPEQETNAGIRALLAPPLPEEKPLVEQQQSLLEVKKPEAKQKMAAEEEIESSHFTGVLQVAGARDLPLASTGDSQTSSIRESKYSAPTTNERPDRREHATSLLTSGGREYFDKKETVVVEKNLPPSEELPLQKVKPRSQRKKNSAADQLLPILEQYFTDRDISIQEQEIIRRNAEINLLIKVPSVVGKLTYFCKAKKKAKCDEGDISSAYMEAQIKKLPLLFLYTHDLTRKAQEMLASDAFQNAVVKNLEKEG